MISLVAVDLPRMPLTFTATRSFFRFASFLRFSAQPKTASNARLSAQTHKGNKFSILTKTSAELCIGGHSCTRTVRKASVGKQNFKRSPCAKHPPAKSNGGLFQRQKYRFTAHKLSAAIFPQRAGSVDTFAFFDKHARISDTFPEL